MEALVSENANCTMLNVSGHTPLDLACQGGHAQVVNSHWLLCMSGGCLCIFLSLTYCVGGEPPVALRTILLLLFAALRYASHCTAVSCQAGTH